jgi:hypothetical protein
MLATDTDAQFTCGGERTFPASALEGPGGAEKESGAVYDALRAAFEVFPDVVQGAAELEWILVDQDDRAALFVGRTKDPPPDWIATEVGSDTGAGPLRPLNKGDCNLRVVISDEYGPATWAIDPAFATPGPNSTEVHLLVWEVACSGGSATTGRISPAVIDYTETTVSITIGVRPLDGFQGCPLPPGTPVVVTLTEPLDSRTLLDGGHFPPAAPSPPP